MKRRQLSNKRHLYNKSLDHVFKTRYQAIAENTKNPRVKLMDVFQQQQQIAAVRSRRTSSALTTADPPTNSKKQRKKSKDRHLEHL